MSLDLRSGIEIKLKPNTNAETVKKQLASNIGKAFRIKTKYEQKKRSIKSCAWNDGQYLRYLSFIMIIVSFNIIGSLFMVVIEKRKDIAILKSIGASSTRYSTYFCARRHAHCGIRCVSWYCSSHYLLITNEVWFCKIRWLSGATFVVEAYPVALKASDIFLTLLTVIFISFLAAYFPARSAARSEINFQR
jgi:lipoprotein-releasing system permease protein